MSAFYNYSTGQWELHESHMQHPVQQLLQEQQQQHQAYLQQPKQQKPQLQLQKRQQQAPAMSSQLTSKNQQKLPYTQQKPQLQLRKRQHQKQQQPAPAESSQLNSNQQQPQQQEPQQQAPVVSPQLTSNQQQAQQKEPQQQLSSPRIIPHRRRRRRDTEGGIYVRKWAISNSLRQRDKASATEFANLVMAEVKKMFESAAAGGDPLAEAQAAHEANTEEAKASGEPYECGFPLCEKNRRRYIAYQTWLCMTDQDFDFNESLSTMEHLALVAHPDFAARKEEADEAWEAKGKEKAGNESIDDGSKVFANVVMYEVKKLFRTAAAGGDIEAEFRAAVKARKDHEKTFGTPALPAQREHCRKLFIAGQIYKMMNGKRYDFQGTLSPEEEMALKAHKTFAGRGTVADEADDAVVTNDTEMGAGKGTEMKKSIKLD